MLEAPDRTTAERLQRARSRATTGTSSVQGPLVSGRRAASAVLADLAAHLSARHHSS